METRTKAVGFAAVFFGLATACAVCVAIEEREARKALDEAESAKELLQAELRRGEARAGQVEAEGRKAAKTPRELRKAAQNSRSENARAKAAADSERAKAVFRALMADPKYRELRQKSIAESLDARYRPLIAKLGLSADVVNRLETASASHQMQMMDLLWSATAQSGDPGANAAVQAQIKALNDQTESDISAALGPDGYRQFQDFNRTESARNLSDQLAAQIYYTGTPLTADQGAALTALISNSSASYQRGGSVVVNTLDWDALMANAQGVLGPAQLAGLQSLRDRLQASLALNQTQAQLRAAANGGGP